MAGAVSVLNVLECRQHVKTLYWIPTPRQGSLSKPSPTPLPARRASGLSRVLWPLPVQRHSLRAAGNELSRAQAIALVQGRYRARVVRTTLPQDKGGRAPVRVSPAVG